MKLKNQNNPLDAESWAIFIHRDGSGIAIGVPYELTASIGRHSDPKSTRQFAAALRATQAVNAHWQLVRAAEIALNSPSIDDMARQALQAALDTAKATPAVHYEPYPDNL